MERSVRLIWRRQKRRSSARTNPIMGRTGRVLDWRRNRASGTELPLCTGLPLSLHFGRSTCVFLSLARLIWLFSGDPAGPEAGIMPLTRTGPTGLENFSLLDTCGLFSSKVCHHHQRPQFQWWRAHCVQHMILICASVTFTTHVLR